ncbi:MAG: hypothetical protein ACRDT0_21775 [Pseudonocardiaceae bacterium]
MVLLDSGMYRHAMWHYREAVDLAHHVGDNFHTASALRYVGLVDWWRGHPNDAMQFYQIAQVMLGPHGDAKLVAWLHALSAHALADMGHGQAADQLARARDSWQPSNAYERADWDYQTALVQAALGRLKVAERCTASINGPGRQRPVDTFAGILRATIHVQTGEPRGLQLADQAINGVARLRSVRARQRLVPLADALDARPGGDARELSQRARRVAAASA